MSELLDETNIKDFKLIFKRFDDNNDGKLSVPEMEIFFRCLNEERTKLQIKELMDEVDITNSGFIDFPQFLSILERKLESVTLEDEIKEAFDIFDFNKDGFISVEELKVMLDKLEVKHCEEDLSIMMQEVDIDKDGQISFEEFNLIMTTK